MNRKILKIKKGDIIKNSFSILNIPLNKIDRLRELYRSQTVLKFIHLKKTSDGFLLLSDNIFLSFFSDDEVLNCCVYEGEFDEFLLYLNINSELDYFDWVEMSKRIESYSNSDILNNTILTMNEIIALKKLLSYDFNEDNSSQNFELF